MALYKSLVKKISVRPEQKVKQKDYQESGVFPIVDQGKEKIGGYSNDEGKVIKCNLPVIVFGDHTRAVKYIDFQFIAGADGIKVIQPNASVLPSFLYYGTQYIVAKMPDRGYARHYQYLEKEDLEIPGINEQRRIVSRIEELFSELDNSVSTLQKTKEQVVVYRQAVLKEAFSTETHAVKKTCEIGEVCLGRQRSPKNVSKYYPTKYIRAANITETGLELDDILEMEFTPVEREKYYLQKGDIVISEASGSATQVGKPAVWNCEIENCCFQNTVIRLRLNKDLPEYVYWYLKFMYSSGAIAKIAGGVGINHLGANKFSNIEIPIPEKEEQKNIVTEIESRLSVCDSIEHTIDTALRQAEAMRQSILKQAFEGRL